MTHDLTQYWHCFVRALLGIGLVAGVAVSAFGKETDQIIVKAKPGRELAAAKARGRGQLKKRIRHEQGQLEVIELPDGVPVEQALADYRASADVEFAEPDYILSINATPNDPRFVDGSQWARNNNGQSGGVHDADISISDVLEMSP